MKITIRDAVRDDIGLILKFINELAEYEQMRDSVVATPEILDEWLFTKKNASVLIAEADGEPAGFALYFYNFSTFLGRGGVYLEDLFVRPEYRRNGIATALFKRLGSIANANGCGRLEWSCLDWNTKAIGFYKSLGAIPVDGWTVYRLTGETLKRLGEDTQI